jgi:ergothioneine biosynthesis protein EgtB
MVTASPEADVSHSGCLEFNRQPWQDMEAALLQASFQDVRQATEKLTAELSPEDQNLQSMPETSPAKWHRAHTTWFFETFILKPHSQGYREFDPQFAYVFNSYYNGIGEQFPRARRGLISRPDIRRVRHYRHHVDEAMLSLIDELDEKSLQTLAPLIILGLNHEQQHQELLVTDLKHAFSHNPGYPAWAKPTGPGHSRGKFGWHDISGGLVRQGSRDDLFCFDNELPRHQVYIANFQIASHPVSCGEFLAFMEDSGYQRPELWLADGWEWIQREKVNSPLYWFRADRDWRLYTLAGERALDMDEPACHISMYEAFAYAHWAGARLPTEAEWELASAQCNTPGHFADSGQFHPRPGPHHDGPGQMFGDVWEWTASSYAPYPGFKAAPGAVGEYNGKFMANQMVLRGGSCATPAGHIRPGYRNFFYPEDRWQFSGLRLARDHGS